jgi:RND family efflux transporter MFP subunit
MKARIVWIAVVVVIVAGIAALISARGEDTPARSIAEIHEADGVPVDVATVHRGDVTVVVEVVGEVTGARQSTLRSSGEQKISRVNVREGQRVRRGQTLVEYDVAVSPDRVARLQQTREAYENAKRQVDRLEPLFETGAISESDLDAAKTQLAIAAANMRDSRLELEVVSPIDGVATLIAVREGDSVADGAVVAQVAALDSVRVVADVSGATAALLDRGDAVHAAGDEVVRSEFAQVPRGVIVRVSLGADPDTRLFRVEALLDNRDGRLMPGDVMRLGVVIDEADNTVVIPSAALQGEEAPRAGAAAPVFVIREGVARLVDVTLGLVADEDVEATSGVGPGERVVVFGANLLEDGAKVRLHRIDGELANDTAAAAKEATD